MSAPYTVLAYFSASPPSEGVNRPPDAGYPGGKTAEGQNPLLSLNAGRYNTPVGWFSLKSNLTGNVNTAFGSATLFGNNSAQREFYPSVASRDLLNLRSNLTVDVFQRDRVDACQLYPIEAPGSPYYSRPNGNASEIRSMPQPCGVICYPKLQP